MIRTLLTAGALALVLVTALPALPVVLALPALAQETISLAEPAGYFNAVLVAALPVVVAWALKLVGTWLDERKLISADLKAAAMKQLEKMADDAIDAGTDALEAYAETLTIKVGNRHVAALAGYIVHQGPGLLRQAGMSEEQVAAWMTRRLAVIPDGKVEGPTPGLAAAVKAQADPVETIAKAGARTLEVVGLTPTTDARRP